jgi:hypothetical protein
MSVPLRKPNDEELAISGTDSSSTLQPTQASKTEVGQERTHEVERQSPHLVQSESSRNADTGELAKGAANTDSTKLFPNNELRELQGRWELIQTQFCGPTAQRRA